MSKKENNSQNEAIDFSTVSHFDMRKSPRHCRWFLKPVAWLIALPGILIHKPKIEKIGMEGIKPPYILLGNHNAFYDMNVSTKATFPHFGNYVVAIDGFIGREWLLRNIGCICKRKFTNDTLLIRHIHKVIDSKGIVAMYPEARYSLCGTTAPLPQSLGRLCQMMNVPVVTLICHGHHINHPFWNTRHERGVKHTEATMKLLFTPEQLANSTPDEINEALVKEFQYDDFKWQKEKGVKVSCFDRAVGLEKILYQCPHCKKEFEMATKFTKLFCKSCGKTWQMTELGELEALDGETEFSHIPDWYEWERANVKKEVAEGTYSTGELPVKVESLPNALGFLPLGKGTLVHDMDGFKVKVKDILGKEYTMEKPVATLYSCHIEFEYLFLKGDCIDLNTLTDTWYIYPEKVPFSVTKIAIATEELYYKYRNEIGRPCPPGLA